VFKEVTDIFRINCESDFEQIALRIFKFQFDHNDVYRKWVYLLGIHKSDINSLKDIPFLPIEFFKSHKITAYPASAPEDIVFISSSTTSQVPSHHFVKDVNVYRASFLKTFSLFFGEVTDYCIIALLPGYLDRQGSSLVYMCNELIGISGHPNSGFYLRNLEELIEVLEHLKLTKQKTLLIGVSYALLDLADKGISLSDNFTVMETGGMKGTRKELLKEELHAQLKTKFGINAIASEYGMTELLTQAYALEEGKFRMPPWMKVMIRDVNDPYTYMAVGKTGGMNVIDLANVHSCSFIATKDLGLMDFDGHLILKGRYDNSDIRGCNLMMA
jgi:phenylacetate-coenzyme A ligase PaaK-like adenylate-forming protein